MCGEFCNVDINFTVSSNRLVGKIASLFATAKGNNSEFLFFRTHASTVVLLPFFFVLVEPRDQKRFHTLKAKLSLRRK